MSLSALFVVLLGVVLFGSLLLIPIGLPGTWIMIAAAIGFTFLVKGSIGWVTLIGVTVLALIAEALEFTLGASYTRKYGGSRRASWGAIIGGLAGVMIGMPVPVVGPVLAGFIGAFVGAWVGEMSKGTSVEGSAQVATGAIVGRAVAAAMKVAVGLIIAAWVMIAAIG